MSNFEKLPNELVFRIFEYITVSDRLLLERVSRKWKELLIQSWKDVRVLRMVELYTSSITDDNIAFLASRVAPFVQRLDFSGCQSTVICGKILSALSCPPCALKEICFDSLTLDSSMLFSVRRIADQITFLEMLYPPTEVTELTEDGRNFFECLPNLVKLECGFVDIDDDDDADMDEDGEEEEDLDGDGDGEDLDGDGEKDMDGDGEKDMDGDGEKDMDGDGEKEDMDGDGEEEDMDGDGEEDEDSSKLFDFKLPSSVKYLRFYCFDSIVADADDGLKGLCKLEEPSCSVKELCLTGFDEYVEDHSILSRLVVRFPNLEILRFNELVVDEPAPDSFRDFSCLEHIDPLENLRELYIETRLLDVGSLSGASSFAFAETLEILHITIGIGLCHPEYLENLSCFPNLKELCIGGYCSSVWFFMLNAAGLEKIAKGCTNLQKIQFPECEAMNNQGLGILGANCRHLQYLDVSDCSEVTEEGVEALVCGISEPQNFTIQLDRDFNINSDQMIRLMKTYGFTANRR